MRPAAFSMLFLGLLLCGCASTAGRHTDPRDPFERFNRASFALNDRLDRAIARPVARGYVRVVPRVARTGVSNFFSNLKQPAVFLSDLLQGKPRPAAHDLGRFLLNSTLGFGGLLDPATEAGLDRNDEDFGQTLGRWGVHTGPYLVIPVFGPRTLRDGFGDLVDQLADPVYYIEEDKVRWSLRSVKLLDQRVRLLGTEQILNRAFDRYAFVRNAYLQRRAYLIRDGASDEGSSDDLETPDEPAD